MPLILQKLKNWSKEMSVKNAVRQIRGKASFAKILGDPVPNYNKDGHEWTIDVELDDETVGELEEMGLGDRVRRKDNYLDGAPYITFRQAATRKDGTLNEPPPVFDSKNEPWPEGTLIGNKSVIDLRFVIKDYGRVKATYMRGVRVLEHVPYVPKVFDDLEPEDDFYVDDDVAGDTLSEDEVAWDND